MVLKYKLWDTSNTNSLEPSASKFQSGFAQDYSIESSEINFMLRMITQNRVAVGTTLFTMDSNSSPMDQGYVACLGGAIGNANSGAAYWANDLAEDLFIHQWTTDASAVVKPSKGASAAADWAANKTITVPYMEGCGIAGASNVTGSVLNEPIGSTVGEEEVMLTEAQLPIITPGVTDPGHFHETPLKFRKARAVADFNAVTFDTIFDGTEQIASTTSTTGIIINPFGGDEKHPNVQPTLVGYFWMKF